MSTNYPLALDTYATLTDNTDDVLAAHANDRGDAIEALETKVGIDSSAVVTSIDYFLKHASGAYRTHQHDATSDDGAKLDWDNCWTDAVHTHTSNAEGGVINSAGAVDGAALTGLTSVPAGAGELPDANKGFPVVLTTDVTGTLPVGKGGTGATAAANAANGVVVLGADAYLADNLVDTTALKTATGEVSSTNSVSTYQILPGGEYGFYPQTKGATTQAMDIRITIDSHAVGTSYATYIDMNCNPGTAYARQRYITASGEDLWIFLLIDKTTKEIVGAYQAPDHPAYGNGGDFNKIPHPFGSYDETKHEIVLLDKETCLTLKQESEQTGKSILTIVNEEYKPNMIREGVYQPLHSGKFIEEKPELVQTIPDYIKVRKLIKLTQADKDAREVKRQEAIQKAQIYKQKKEQNRISVENKLKVLGFTEDEIMTTEGIS